MKAINIFKSNSSKFNDEADIIIRLYAHHFTLKKLSSQLRLLLIII